MDIEKYRTFVMAAKCRSFMETAERLYLTTPTVTKHISALEQSMGVSLFDRLPHGIRLTDEGKARLELAEQIVSSYDSLHRMNAKNEFKLYCFPSQRRFGLPEFLAGFWKHNPEISIEVIESYGPALLNALLSQQCELIFIQLLHKNCESIDYIEVLKDRLCAILPEGHPLSDRDEISLSELKNDPFILLKPESGMYNFYYECCESCGFKPNIKITPSREDDIISYVKNGVGVTLMDRRAFSYYDTNDAKAVTLKEEFFTGCILAKNKGRKLSAPAMLFWKYIASLFDK